MARPRLGSETRGLTQFGRSVAFTGAALLALGLAFGDFPYLLCAALLLGAAFAARTLKPAKLEAARVVSAEDIHAGDRIEITIEVRSAGVPVGLLLHDKAPDAFVLSAGANVEATHLRGGAVARIRYALKSPRRGQHGIGPLRATTFDPLFLQSALVAEAAPPTDVLVHPRTPQAPRIRTSAAWGRAQLPGGDKAHRGILTNDFRELRPYEKGDPLRQVNWKATARQSRDELKLIVNDYEVEGKKSVWIFCDASAYTIGGTTTESAFDELSNGALAVAGHYLDMGHRVGFTLFGSGEPRLLYPDSGDLQERRIAALVASAQPGTSGPGIANTDAPADASSPQWSQWGGIAAAVEQTKGFLVREKPLLFVFTLAGRDPELAAALAAARAFATPGRRPAPVVAVTPVLGSGDEASMPSRMVALREKAQLKGLERRGITVLRYHPTTQPLVATLARGFIR